MIIKSITTLSSVKTHVTILFLFDEFNQKIIANIFLIQKLHDLCYKLERMDIEHIKNGLHIFNPNPVDGWIELRYCDILKMEKASDK